MDFANINWLAVGASAIAAFALGFVWYSVLFGKTWQRLVGLSDEDIQSGNMGLIFGSSFVLMAVMALGLAMMIYGHGDQPPLSLTQGALHGLFMGLFFVGTSMGINMLYQRKSIALWFIDAGYQILFLTIMGTIMAAWPK